MRSRLRLTVVHTQAGVEDKARAVMAGTKPGSSLACEERLWTDLDSNSEQSSPHTGFSFFQRPLAMLTSRSFE